MIRLFAAVTIGCLTVSGCAELSASRIVSREPAETAAELDMETLNRVEAGFHVIDTGATQLDLQHLQAGQQVRIVATVSDREEVLRGGSVAVVDYAGTIQGTDANTIKLTDVSLVTTRGTPQAIPALARLPYIARLFNRTAIACEFHPLAHDVTLPRIRCVVAYEATDLPMERTPGVDFDTTAHGAVLSDVETHLAADRDQLTR